MADVKLVIKRGKETGVSSVPVVDGQLIFAKDTGRIWLDAEDGRVEVAGGAVKSINGEKPDDNGNVNISTDVEGVVKSINGEKPDSDGDVSLDIGTVKSVNGVGPDADGNVTISTGEGSGAEGTVKSVNGVGPDADGNVEVNVGVLTVNGVKPDADGNIEIETNGDVSTSGLVKSVAGVEPDDAGNVDGDSLASALGMVKSVNGVEPDADGNVKITTDSSSGTSINHLVIQRPVSDLALYPYVEASESPDYDNSLEIDLYDDYDGNASYCKVFNGDSWMDIPKSGLGTPFDGMEVEIELSKFEGLSQPYYLRYGWVTSDGAYSNYRGMIFPCVTGTQNSYVSRSEFDALLAKLKSEGIDVTTSGDGDGEVTWNTIYNTGSRTQLSYLNGTYQKNTYDSTISVYEYYTSPVLNEVKNKLLLMVNQTSESGILIDNTFVAYYGPVIILVGWEYVDGETVRYPAIQIPTYSDTWNWSTYMEQVTEKSSYNTVLNVLDRCVCVSEIGKTYVHALWDTEKFSGSLTFNMIVKTYKSKYFSPATDVLASAEYISQTVSNTGSFYYSFNNGVQEEDASPSVIWDLLLIVDGEEYTYRSLEPIAP